MTWPSATYRLQLRQRFTFHDARALVAYLDALGISHLYLSPILAARAGSPHGYDATDATRLNPEYGGEADFDELAAELRERGMGLVLDIVPNHMAASVENPWWRDVLEHGQSSAFSSYFDIQWSPGEPALEDRVLLPILGDHFGAVLERGELALGLDEDGLHVRYFERRLPLDPRTYPAVLLHRLDGPRLEARPALRQLNDIAEAFAELPDRGARGEGGGDGRRAAPLLVAGLWRLCTAEPDVRAFVEEKLREFNGRPGDPGSWDLLDRLLAGQPYRLCYWRLAAEELNYRRFFDIADLVGVRVEDPEVLEATHRLIFRLVAEGRVEGLRVDHIDGLYDPLGYLRRLRDRVGTSAYLIVEKILSGEEELPPEWPVDGTTGYEFLNTINGVFLRASGVEALGEVYRRFTGLRLGFREVAYRKRKQVSARLFAGEMRSLAAELRRLARHDRHGRDLAPSQLERALVEVSACLPVYRTYTRDFAARATDRATLERTLREARRRAPGLDPVAFDFLERALRLEAGTAAQRWSLLRWVMRWQQVTGPVAAKGVEDSSLYVFNPLLSLNEVGGDPAAAAVPARDFHRTSRRRLERWPGSLSATSTHDTKRSEDVRARLNVLSEVPRAWARHLGRWRKWNTGARTRVRGRMVPDRNDEILLYQTLVGAWPLDDTELPAFPERLAAFLVKATREARVHSSWTEPDEEYEQAVVAFARRILDADAGRDFLQDFLPFQRKIARHGASNSLGQLLLKVAAPGIPDFFQGMELWDFSLVDPDNRRAVDFERRTRLLDSLPDPLAASPASVRALMDSWPDGRVKLLVTRATLRFRREQPKLFQEGEYIPLAASGPRRDHVLAFARRAEGHWALALVTRRPTALAGRARSLGEGAPWGETRLRLPPDSPRQWRSVLTGEVLRADADGLAAGEALAALPVALLAAGT